MNSDQKLEFYSILNKIQNGIYISDTNYNLQFLNLTMIQKIGNKVGEKCYKIIANKNEVCLDCKFKQKDYLKDDFCYKANILFFNNEFNSFNIILYNMNKENFKLGILQDLSIGKNENFYNKNKIYQNDYKRIFDHVAVGVFISSKEGKFIDANPALLGMLGYKNKTHFLKLDLIKDLYLNPGERANFQIMIEAKNKVTD